MQQAGHGPLEGSPDGESLALPHWLAGLSTITQQA